MTYRETITSTDGSTEEGTCTEEHALSLLRTAVRRGYRTEATRAGGAVIVRDVHSGEFVPRHRTVTLEPVTATGTLTATVRADLDAIARYPRSYLAGEGTNAGRIIAGLIYGIPPATAARLMARGLVAVGEAVSEHGQKRRPVAVSLAARLAMLAQDHHTSTSEPRGYVRPADVRGLEGHIGPWRTGGCTYIRSSVASCPCRWSCPCEDREDARRKAHEHRQQVTAELVTALGGLKVAGNLYRPACQRAFASGRCGLAKSTDNHIGRMLS